MEIMQCSQTSVPLSTETMSTAIKTTSSDESSSSNPVPASATAPTFYPVKLPQLDLPIFKGDSVEWLPFWSMFKESVHKTPTDSVQKFHYLITLLRGEVARTIAGLAQTPQNYPVAIDLLHQSYEKKGEIANHHYKKLCKFCCDSRDVSFFVREMEVQLRSLEA